MSISSVVSSLFKILRHVLGGRLGTTTALPLELSSLVKSSQHSY